MGRRRGLTLVELMIAVAIMTIIAGTISAVSMAMQQASNYTYDRGTALQHGRVALERINQQIAGAYTAPGHPGVAVYVETLGTYRYPDTLLVWRPAGTPANVNGPPLISEVYFYCFDPTTPGTLIELTAPSDNRTIPLDATLQTSTWKTALDGLKMASTSKKTTLTTLLRTATVTGSAPSSMSKTRGVVRFELTVTPSLANITSYQGGSITWANLPWPQGLYSSLFGMRQVWLRSELQLMPASKTGQQDTSGQLPIPVFGSQAIYSLLTP
ncbi:MAG: prepilin-type N-terminal cleavage/methylation domain-containing protein [Planctomycetes bacterium]|nr:prepilin-type N-terminal cleavage/methylation domain-containing protein [Planctomycetota bacterium]